MEKIEGFSGDYFFLSNFYTAPILFDGIRYKNNESAFQAQKLKDWEGRKQFSVMIHSKAKALGRRVKLRNDWEKVKIELMYEICKEKFLQHPDLKDKLVATGDCYLEEGNTWGDRFWGTVNGIGGNHLGLVLMKIRKELS